MQIKRHPQCESSQAAQCKTVAASLKRLVDLRKLGSFFRKDWVFFGQGVQSLSTYGNFLQDSSGLTHRTVMVFELGNQFTLYIDCFQYKSQIAWTEEPLGKNKWIGCIQHHLKKSPNTLSHLI